MCGIAGFFEPEERLSPAEQRDVLARMCNVIEHRGPDDEGFFVEEGVALGMRRLSIIDLYTGHQPISNEDGTVWIVFNGEIYNYRELRDELLARGHIFKSNTDTETIIHLYEEEGEQCVRRLRGMFAFAIYDKRHRKLFIARDRVGVKPLHYALVGDRLIFGSEIKSLLQHPLVPRAVNHEAISDFLSFSYIPDPHTAFRGIRKLPAGHTLTFKDGFLVTRSYWDFEYPEEAPEADVVSEAAYIERLRELLAESVRIRLMSDVPLGAFLSGGIDSSTVVAMMTRAMDRPVQTFSIGFTESSHDELHYARIAAQHFETDHHEFIVTPDVCRIVEEIVWHHDEPFADMSSVPTYIVSKMAREHVTVVLSGDGGDELFAGYERYLVDRQRQKFERVPGFFRRNLMLPAARRLPSHVYGKNYLRNVSLDPGARYIDSISCFDEEKKQHLLSNDFRRSLARYNSTDKFIKLFAAPGSHERLDHLLYLDSKTYLPGDILTKVDRMSMAHSIEAREPLLDYKLIEFAQRVPASLKLRGSETKSILKRAMRGIIPDEIINRPKQGFGVPMQKWFREDLREMVIDTLTDSRTRQRGYFNQRAVSAILREHLSGRRDNSRHLWSLLMLELWHRAFIDHQPEPAYAGAKKLSLNRLTVGAPA
ncbi:MAG: asparagine synthase (glutamine-hydrolyzing) [Blastocatellia bacterium]